MREPAVLVGPSALDDALASFDGPAVAFVDRAASRSDAAAAALRHLRADQRFEAVHLVDRPPTAEGLLDLAAAQPDVRLVVGIGGGTVMDLVKLLAALHRSADTARFLRVSQRAGWTSLGPATKRHVALLLVPTTLGTGAELSRAACLEEQDGKRLIEGEILRADVAVLDPRATATLPGELVMEGVFEAWNRLLGALVCPSASPSEDAIAMGLAAQLTRLGDEARGALAAGGTPQEELRLEIARVSAMSHTHSLHRSRPLFPYKTWFLATELARHGAARKVPALAAVLPPVWGQILSGDGTLGDRSALLRAWRAVAEASSAPRPDDPVEGVRALMRSWGIQGPLASPDPAVVARSALRRWGAGLPMLGVADGPTLERIFAACKKTSTTDCGP